MGHYPFAGMEVFMSFWRDPIIYIINWANGLLASIGWGSGWATIVGYIIGAFIMAGGGMFFVVFLIWYERKLIGRFQDRFGPNRVGPWGIFQPVADMFKIFTKELITPAGVDWIAYNLAPVLSVGAALLMWSVTPFSKTFFVVNISVGILFLIAVGGLGELAIILAGWGSNNKYALVGALRAVAQLVSYEVPFVISALVPVMLSGSMSLVDIVEAQDPWYILVAPAAALIFFIAAVAESGRAPFDLAEAESEIVAGYNVEYSGLKFGMFFVGEFLRAFTTSFIFVTVFLGGWRGPGAQEIPILGFIYLGIKTMVVYFLTVLIRGSLPRFRIDQMMDLNWKILTPLALVVVAVTALVDKAYASGATLMRVGAFLVTNLVVLLAAAQIMRWFALRRKAKLVGFETDEDDDTAVKPERASA
jgi:NADH-quinone oxidoreductase subunit H